MFIIKYKWIFLSISAALVFGSLALVAINGVKKGIDFTGGTNLTVQVDGVSTDLAPVKANLENAININTENKFKIISVNTNSTTTSDGISTSSVLFTVKLGDNLDDKNRVNFINAFQDAETKATIINEDTIGPSIGKELTQKAIISILLVAFFIVLFVAYTFREVSKPVHSFQYGLITIVTLIHDVVIPTGLYALLGEKYGYEVDSLFIVAILTIMGISISDTIVVFDRIRENLKKRNSGETFSETVGKSLSQTFGRSINTSLAVIIVLFALFYYGPAATHGMALVLVTGMIVGTYSSIFVASPLLTLVEKWSKK